MGLVGWLLSLRPGYTEPAEVHQLVAESSGRWVAARLAGDRVRVWDGEGRPIWSGVLPGLGLWPGGEGRWLELGDGSALDLEAAGGPARVEGRGLRVWAGQRALIFTPGHIQAEGHTPLEAGPCDPSPDLRALPGPGGRVALVDLAWEGPLVWTPDAVLRGEGGPVGSACWVADRLYGVQGGVLRAWDADLSPLEPRRPHGLQTLAVAAGPPGPVTLGLGARGLELAWPGQAPILSRGGSRHRFRRSPVGGWRTWVDHDRKACLR